MCFITFPYKHKIQNVLFKQSLTIKIQKGFLYKQTCFPIPFYCLTFSYPCFIQIQSILLTKVVYCFTIKKIEVNVAWYTEENRKEKLKFQIVPSTAILSVWYRAHHIKETKIPFSTITISMKHEKSKKKKNFIFTVRQVYNLTHNIVHKKNKGKKNFATLYREWNQITNSVQRNIRCFLFHFVHTRNKGSWLAASQQCVSYTSRYIFILSTST